MKNNLYNIVSILKNGQLANRSYVYQKKKKICQSFLTILWNEGLIIGYKTSNRDATYFKIFLKYFSNGKPTISNMRVISKPGRRVYYSLKQIWRIDTTKTLIVLSTNKGLKTVTECKQLKLGGEPFIIVH